MTDERRLRLRQVRSTNGIKPKQRANLRTLGLGDLGDTAVKPDRPEIRGMIAKVSHLVSVEEGRES